MTAPPADSDEWDRLNNNGPNAQIDPVSFILILPYSLITHVEMQVYFSVV